MLNANPRAAPHSHGRLSTHRMAAVNASSISTFVSRWLNSPLILSAVQIAPKHAARATSSGSTRLSSRRTSTRLTSASVNTDTAASTTSATVDAARSPSVASGWYRNAISGG